MKAEYSILPQYIAESETVGQLYSKIQEYSSAHGVIVEQFCLNSQFWPKEESYGSIWKHELFIYKPSVIASKQVLLFVNGGTRYSVDTLNNPQPHVIDFAKLAEATQTIIVDLQDIPNQYLSLKDNTPRMGDGLLAYTWGEYMQNPVNKAYWPLYFPMTKSVIKAMDAVQAILTDKNILIENFVLSGLSKRGLAAWLAALMDKRVSGLIPIVIDILNTVENMKHIYAFYNNKWPAAFDDFVAGDMMSHMTSPVFETLLNIEDPLCYIKESKHYQERSSIPKYIISASGDDLFVPDSLNLYWDELVGEKYLRVLPNQGHFIDMQFVEESLHAFLLLSHQQAENPVLEWEFRAGGLCKIIMDKRPLAVNLWYAHNPHEKDFRKSAGILYHSSQLSYDFSNIGYHAYVDVEVPSFQQGWVSYFVEVIFPHTSGVQLTLTTPCSIKAC
jgi:PhoPQ-activated pathogenicity-related protein